MFKNFKKFNKTPLFVSIAFLIFSSSFFVFFYQQISENRKISERTQIEWGTEAIRRDEIRSLERSIREIENERNLLESHFAYSANVVPFLDTIEQLAVEAKAKPEITSVDILKDQKKLSVVVKASGSFESIYKFLTLLENSTYEIEFVSVGLQRLNRQIIPGAGPLPEWEAIFKVQLISFIQ